MLLCSTPAAIACEVVMKTTSTFFTEKVGTVEEPLGLDADIFNRKGT